MHAPLPPASSANLPPKLRAGTRIHVVAPSGPVPAPRLDKGMRALQRQLSALDGLGLGQGQDQGAGFDVALAGNILEQDGYFAGPDALRAECLHAAFAETDPGVILCARGGYGLTRLLGRLDPARLRRHPKIIVGFSDVTALLCWAWVAASVPSVHGPVLTQLGGLHPGDVAHLFDLMRGELPPPLVASEGAALNGGTVEGRLICGNLEVLRSLVGTKYFPSMRGNILGLEEVNEAPYRIDRALTQLISSGALRGLRGVVVGQLSMCNRPTSGVGPTADEVVLERLSTLGVPVVTGFEFGHNEGRNVALPFGGRVRLHANDCTLELLEPIVE